MRVLPTYPKEVKVFLLASLINSTGSALMWPLTTMFVFDELGHNMADAGLVILIQALGGIVGQLLGGSMYHRVGVKKLIVGSLVLNAVGLFALPVTSQFWYFYMGLMGFIGFCNALSLPAIQAFIGFRFADRRGELFNIVYVANNIGVALGTALSGFLADISYKLTFIANGLTSAVFAVFFLIYLNRLDDEQGEVHLDKRHTSTSGESIWRLLGNTRIYLYLGIGSMFILLGNSMWNSGVSPFIISEGFPKKAYGFLWTLNGILIFVAQPIISLLKRWLTKSAASQMTMSAVFYLSSYIVILITHNYPGLVLAMVLATLGEMLISPAIPAFISDHAGRAAPFYIGLSGGVGAIGRVIGPYTMGLLYDGGGLIPVTWLATVTAVIGVLFFIVHAMQNRGNKSEIVSSGL
ncbi:MFS transporter [Paenibacillus macquariensis]|uniref:Predicted arabinose efflux permease, MFS family n=1 Tax=Paenibacillus macquariensis TaxID=948756 RepID=A0ABY1K9N1_9BACL|nr:MFS transporter [Paenibacillus macquariensis]MEC0092453.1 MFS transporter [Paenibacillus macquariensis]OAB35414.1 MFS transporter [Paenibacillus macquariensis subsp. macquariensis]SIR47159.1 Predicted arabinose efflux permease, MFS family [Paenibacillus macquariensis]